MDGPSARAADVGQAQRPREGKSGAKRSPAESGCWHEASGSMACLSSEERKPEEL